VYIHVQSINEGVQRNSQAHQPSSVVARAKSGNCNFSKKFCRTLPTEKIMGAKH